MPTIHAPKTGNYTCVSNKYLQDRSLSLKAKGLLSLLLSIREENWEWSIVGLASLCRDGVDSVRKGLEELHQQGYFFQQRKRLPNGRLGEAEYWIFEEPQADIPTEIQMSEKAEGGAQKDNSGVCADTSATGDFIPCCGQKELEPEPVSEHRKTDLIDSVPASAEAHIPELDFPKQEDPEQEKPTLENRPQLNIKEIKNQMNEINNETNINPIYPIQGVSHSWEIGVAEAGGQRSSWQGCSQRRYATDSAVGYKGMTLEQTRAYLREKVEYDSFKKDFNQDMIDEILDIMVEILISKGDYIMVSGERMPRELAIARIEAYDFFTLRYVLRSLYKTTSKVHNIRRYLLTCILNAPTTITNVTLAQCRNDMPWLVQKRGT